MWEDTHSTNADFLFLKHRGSAVLAVPVLIFDTTDNFKQSGSVTTDEHMLSWYICACDLLRGNSGQPQLFTTYTWSSRQIAKPTHQYMFFFFFFSFCFWRFPGESEAIFCDEKSSRCKTLILLLQLILDSKVCLDCRAEHSDLIGRRHQSLIGHIRCI